MPTETRSRLLCYGLAILLVALTVVGKLFLDSFLGTGTPLLLFFAATMVSAWYGGLGPGLLAVFLSACALGYFFLSPHYASQVDADGAGRFLRLGLWLLEGSLVVWLVESLHVARRQSVDLSALKEQERDRAERIADNLRQSEHELADFFENSVLGLHCVAADGRILRANQAELDMLGYAREEYVGHPITEFHVDPDTVEDMLGRLRGGEVLTNYEARLRCKNGAIKHVLMDSNVQRKNGQFVHTRCFTRDITERKHVEEALRASEESYRRIAETANEGIWMIGPEAQTTFINRRMADILGCRVEEMPNRPALDFVFEEDRAGVHERIQNNLVGKVEQFDLRLRRLDGSEVHVLCCTSPVSDGQGTIVGALGMFSDITERKRAENSLREADRRKDEFLAMLSHELRNPLGAVRNALHIMHASPVRDPELREARGVIERQVQLLARIVDDLLDVFRITHHKIALKSESLDLANLVRLTVEDHRSALEGTQVELKVKLPRKPVWVLGDRTRLCQMMSNLVHNAAKFTNAGGEVTVVMTADEETRRAVVCVRDTGIGIAADMLPHVFETFAQAGQSMDRGRGGLGLGLALVKGLVELHGGEITASSPGLGRGSEFTLWLPLSAKPSAEAGTAPPPTRAARSLRIAIVEDNRDTARSLRTLLTRYGHEVAMAHSGPAGVSVTKEWQPDVVLCDLGLPKMDGFEVARTLREDPSTAAVRLIAVSGYGQDEDRRRSKEAGFDLHLTKPVDPVELLRLLAVLKVGPA